MPTSSILSKWLPWVVLLVAAAKLGEMIWLKRTGQRPSPSSWVFGLMAVAIVLAGTAVVYQLYYGR